MGHDLWLESLRRAAGSPDALGRLLAEDLPTDALQQIGDALLAVSELAGTDLSDVVDRLVEQLRERRWDGDDELADALDHVAGRGASPLRPLPVELDDVGDALRQHAGSENYLDLQTGTVWLQSMTDFGVDDDLDVDFEDETRWLFLEGEGSRDATATWNASSRPSMTTTSRPGSLGRSRDAAPSGVSVLCSNAIPSSTRDGIASMPTPGLDMHAAGSPTTATRPDPHAGPTSHNRAGAGNLARGDRYLKVTLGPCRWVATVAPPPRRGEIMSFVPRRANPRGGMSCLPLYHLQISSPWACVTLRVAELLRPTWLASRA